jgi:chorismate mutase
MTIPSPRLQGIRGATTVDRNDAAEILGATDELLRTLIEANNLTPDDIVSGLFTVTPDLDAAFPARAAEEFGWNIVALLHATEIPVPGSLAMCIRLLVHAYTPRPRAEIKHCYLRGATVLRPDRA